MKSEKAQSATRPLNFLQSFLQLESAGGLLLLLAAIVALIAANSPLQSIYSLLINTPVVVSVGELEIAKPLLLWINDGLMAIFFFLIGLELKREILDGELSSIQQVILPAMGAVGGMLVPAAIYLALNWQDAEAVEGWAIPVATDIAFALALLGIFGRRVPVSLKVFLLTLAILDDLAAIVIIALFYSGDLSVNALWVSFAVLSVGIVMNRLGIVRTSAYILLGVVLWVGVLKSGVHATLAGVLLAFCIPLRAPDGTSPLRNLEHNLHGPVAFAILPLFAFANSGLILADVSLDDLTHPVTSGIVLGLLIGKPLGVMLFTLGALKLGLARLPENVTVAHLLGVSFTCGIGFTMSLFIAGLAFEHGATTYFIGDRLGILIASTLSALAAFIILSLTLPSAQMKTTHSNQST